MSGSGTLEDQGTLGVNTAQSLANPFVVKGAVTGTGALTVTGVHDHRGCRLRGPRHGHRVERSCLDVPIVDLDHRERRHARQRRPATMNTSSELYIDSATVTNNGTLTMESGSEIYG